jgi:hypothetical protein
MQESTDDFVLQRDGDVWVLKPKILWVETMMFILTPVMMAFFGFALYRGADQNTGAQIATSLAMIGILFGGFVLFLLGRSTLIIRTDEVAFRLGMVWRRRSLKGVKTCHTMPLPKGHFSLVELELEDGSRRKLARLRNGAADRLTELICDILGVSTPAEVGREALALPTHLELGTALCTVDEYVAGQPKGARNPLLAIYALLEFRSASGQYEAPPSLAKKLTDLGFRRIGSSKVVWSLMPFPIKAATYVNEDGSVVAELLRSEGDKYHLVSYTTTPMIRWSWSKVAPTTKSSRFVCSAPTTGSLELDYAAHRQWLLEQVRQGAKVATVNTIDDYLTLGNFQARQLVSENTAVGLLVLPLTLLIPIAVLFLK